MKRMRASGAGALCLAAAAGFFFGIVGMEQTFGRLRDRAAAPLLYAVELHDAGGALLASPLLVGTDDARVHLDLNRPAREGLEGAGSAALNMSLDLSPVVSGSRAICVEYRVSLDAGTAQRGQLALSLGERGSLQISGQDGAPLRLDVTIARAGSKAFDALLRARRRGKPLI